MRGIKRKYILYPAATWVHKNHTKLLDAVKKIRDEGLDFDLVCTGNKMRHYKVILKKIEKKDVPAVPTDILMIKDNPIEIPRMEKLKTQP